MVCVSGWLRALRMALAVTLLGSLLGCGSDGDELTKGMEVPAEPVPQILVTPTDLLLSLDAMASTVIVENSGEAPLTIQSVVLTGTDFGSFTIAADDCSGRQLPVDLTCFIDVAFTETAASEQRSAALVIASNDPDSPTVQVGLWGGPTPFLSATPPALVFNLQRVNTASASQTITFANTGNVDLDGLSLAFGAEYPADFLVAEDGCSRDTRLAIDETCDVTVVFAPVQGGARSGTLTATTTPSVPENAPTVDVEIDLSGLGEPEPFSVSPVVVDFGAVAVGETSVFNQTVTFENHVAEELVVELDALAGADAASFGVGWEDCSAAPVGVDGTCRIELIFSAASVGPKNATLTLRTADETLSVALTGVGLGVGVAATPAGYDFGGVSVGGKSTAAFTLRSTGNEELVIGAITVAAPDFSLLLAEDGCSGQTLTPAESCSLVVEYAPTVADDASGIVTVPTNVWNLRELTLALTGSGLASVALSPSRYDFGSTTQAFTFSNAGVNPVFVSWLSVAGPSDTDFSLTADTCTGETVAAGASCTFDLGFAPTAEGRRSARITVASDDGIFPQVVADVAGIGLEATTPVGMSSPAAAAFDTQGVGSDSNPMTIQISNAGQGDLILGSGFLDGADKTHFRMMEDLCSVQTLAPAGTCTVQVVFAPESGGAKSAALAFPSNDPAQPGASNPITAPLTGFGVSALAVTPRTLGFGTLALGLTSGNAEVFVANLGSTPATVDGIQLSGAGFLLVANACSDVVLQPGGRCTAEVAFAPQELGVRSGTLNISSAAGPIGLALSGVAIAPVSVSPPSADAGEATVGTTVDGGNFTVTNRSGQKITVDQLTITGPFSLRNDSCTGQILAADASCSFGVDFSPLSAGAAEGTVSVGVNGIAEAVTIPLSGIGI